MTAINQIVNVNAYYFENGQDLRAFPRRIEFGNTSFTFEEGLQYIVKKGQHVIKFFDMTDGRTIYRLRKDDDTWTLIGTRDSS